MLCHPLPVVSQSEQGIICATLGVHHGFQFNFGLVQERDK
jgi:hypothetical protein